MLIKAEYIDRFKIIKSQMAFDFSAPKHEEERTVRATTRHLASGTVAQVQAHQRRTEVNMQDMVHEARRWKGAAMNADEDHGADNRARLKHSRITTKADLDNYLMRKFGVDETTARSVSNHLTEKDIPADRSAEPADFAGEAWADAVITKKTAPTPTGAQTIEARKINARDRFEQSLQTIAGISPEQATRVADYYVKHKLVKTDANVGQINPVHGAYLDKDVILNAVKETEPAAQSSHPTREDLDSMKVKNCRSIKNTPAFTRYKFNDNRSAVAAQQKIGGIRMDNTLVIAIDPDAKAEIPAVHAQDNRIYTTPEANQKNVAALLNDFLAPLNITFSYGKSSELQGAQGQAYILDGSRRLLTRKDATIDTLAHEIAHFVQYDQKGYTHCGSLKSSQGSGEGEHMRLTREYTAKLKQNKLGHLFMKANGVPWRTMVQDLEGAISPASPAWEQNGKRMTYRVDFPESHKKDHHIIASYQPKPGGWDYHYQLEEKYKKDGKQVKIVHLTGKHAFESEAKNMLLNEVHKKTQSIQTAKKTPSWHQNSDLRRSVSHPVSLVKSRKLHGSINFNGLDISIETGRSRCREWYNPHDGSQGMSRMTLPYGYIKRSLGVDGDHYDAFVGPDHSAPNVYIVTTMKAPDFTEIDEEKAFLGVNSAEEAERYYKASYSDDRFFGGITAMPFEEFKEKVLATKDNPELLA